MTLSSRRGCSCGPVDGVVAQHRPQDVEASAGQGDDGLGVGFAFGSLAVVVRPGGGVGADGDVGGQVAGAQQSSVVAAGAFEVAADAPGVSRYRGQSGHAGEAVDAVEGAHVTAGGGEEFGAEVTPKPGMLRMISAWRWRRNRSSIIASVSPISVSRAITSLASRATIGGGQLLAGHDGVLGVSGVDGGGCDGVGVAGLAFPQPGLQPGSTGSAQPVGGLVAGEQDQRGLAFAVVKGALQGREVLQQLGAQPVDRSGAIGHQIGAPGGQDAQLHRDVITGTQRLQVAAHAGLIGDDRGVFGVGLAVPAVTARGVIDGAAGNVEQPLSRRR